MTLNPNMVQALEACTTSKQVYDLLDINCFWIAKHNAVTDSFSVWLDETTRIYQPHGSKTMKVEG